MQEAMDDVVTLMMSRYNRDQVIVYNTYQMYRHDKLEQLRADFLSANKDGYMLGAKLVRGAYMEKEREKALQLGYPSPIQIDKAATDKDFDKGIAFCLDRYEELAFCNASHNVHSVQVMVDAMIKLNIPRDHKHVNFCQLQGME